MVGTRRNSHTGEPHQLTPVDLPPNHQLNRFKRAHTIPTTPTNQPTDQSLLNKQAVGGHGPTPSPTAA